MKTCQDFADREWFDGCCKKCHDPRHLHQSHYLSTVEDLDGHHAYVCNKVRTCWFASKGFIEEAGA